VRGDLAAADEAALVERAKRGDRDAFSELVECHASAVLTVAWRIVGDRTRAEDVAQETFLAAFRSLPGFRVDARFSTWLYRIAVNKCRDFLRSQAGDRHVSLPDEDGEAGPEPAGTSSDHRTPEDRLLDEHRARQIAEALGRLAPVYREAFVLKHVEGLSYDEMTEVLGVEGSTLRMRVYKARQELSRALAGLAVR
jgi:RNA polymerase sigma-70 factor (ECF subfamily)